MPEKRLRAVLVAGPTASGKSDLACALAQRFNGHIINADSAQMYTPLAVGTAKPDWEREPVKHHLFDILSTPEHYDVVQYRTTIMNLVETLNAQGIVPFIVGGSLFYHKSLFYPPVTPPASSDQRDEAEERRVMALSAYEQWEYLHAVDAKRAAALHPNDTYRIQRALSVWFAHGVKPSTLKPEYRPFCDTHILFLSPDISLLTQRIKKRTNQMLERGDWIGEALKVYKDKEWKAFIDQKKFIGYPEIFSWIERGMKPEERDALVERIVINTRSYAKRQAVFWQSFLRQLSSDAGTSMYQNSTTTLSSLESVYQDAENALEDYLNDSVAKASAPQ